VEAESGKIRIRKTEGGGNERRSRKEMRGKEKDAEVEERKDDGSKENSRGVGNLGQRRRDSKTRSRSKKTGARKFPQVD